MVPPALGRCPGPSRGPRRARLPASREIAKARQHDQAEHDLGDARAAEQRGLAAIDDALTAMWNALGSAQRFLRAAVAAEHGVNEARRKQIDARGQLGEWPAHHPGSTPARANAASLLAEQDDLVALLARWSR
jgi:hypothetical protein